MSYTITQHPSPNCWTNRNGQHVAAIVDHITANGDTSDGSQLQNPQFIGSVNWLCSQASQVSAHFVISRAGEIYQLVNTDNAAWANGIVEPNWDTSLAWLKACVAAGENPNNLTISIEHSGNPNVPLTEKQYQASLWLHSQLITKYGLAPSRACIIGHYQITPESRANCPSSAFPFDRLIKDLNTMNNQTNPYLEAIGAGAKAVLQAHGDVPNTGEIYEYDSKGSATMSRVYFTNPSQGNGVIIWSADTNTVHRYLVSD